jgi:endonuclease-8
MPEGDSIHNLAARLRPRLVGRQVRAFAAHDIDDRTATSLVGRTVVSVEARGKNLLVRFDDDRALHIHLRMLGRVRFLRPRSAYWRPRKTTHQLRFDVDGAVVVGDRIPVLRLLRAGAASRAPDLARLGPDLLAVDVDVDECVRRLRALGARAIGEALLVQRALSGIGNIYKSETLFLERVDPLAPAAALGDERLLSLVRRASALLRSNLGAGPRVTRPTLDPRGPGRFWVYGRRGAPCFRCKTPIAVLRQGAPPGRSTYHCPRCQAP